MNADTIRRIYAAQGIVLSAVEAEDEFALILMAEPNKNEFNALVEQRARHQFEAEAV